MPFTQSKVILFSRKGGGELRIFHCNFLGYVRCHNFASEQLCVKPSRLIKILTFIQGGRERQSSMKCNEALLKSYSSLQHDPHFQNSFSKMTWHFGNMFCWLYQLFWWRKLAFQRLLISLSCREKKEKCIETATRFCYCSPSLLADLWRKMSQLVFGYFNIYSKSYYASTWLIAKCQESQESSLLLS